MKIIPQYLTAIAVIVTMAEAAPTIYPTPQQANFPGGTTLVKKVELVKKNLEVQGNTTHGQGYAITVTPGKVVIRYESDDALYYAKQTLSQMLEGVENAQNAQRDPFPMLNIELVAKLGELPLGSVVDWPDLEARGVVEGYYGTPWTRDMRASQFAFYGRNKMNTYMYAPKDDPYHHGQGCYKPYPEDKAAEIRELVQIARKNHVRFVWGIHPANTVRWADNEGRKQLDALCSKLQHMYDLGVRDFAVLVDDSSGEISKAERQAQLCNYLLENFIRKHKDVNQTLIMCPTGYNRSWTSPKFLNTLGANLEKTIPVMWTGNTVVNNITLESQSWVYEHLKRPTFVWWNWPCSDFKRSRLSMGRAYGMGQEAKMKELLSGFVANPMEQGEANKVGLFGVADYTWNVQNFNSERSWEDGIRRLYPKDAEAMQVFCNHNSYLLPNGHGYNREESVKIKDTADTFTRSIESGTPDAAAMTTMRAEFDRMQKAGESLLASKNLGALKDEITPWLEQFRLTGGAGVKVLDALKKEKRGEKLSAFFAGMDMLAKMRDTKRMEWNGGKPKPVSDVEVAMLVMTPALRTAFRYVNRSVYSALSGRSVSTPVFSASRGNAAKDRANLEDGNTNTFWSTDSRMQAGDWFCLDYGEPISIRCINLLMGGPRADDYAKAVQFEVSDDGHSWRPVGSECNGPAAVLQFTPEPIRARMVRFRITGPQDRWLSIYEFSVNRVVPPYVTSNLAARPKLIANFKDQVLSVNRVMEVFKIQKGEFIELEMPSLVIPEWVEINVENADLLKWADVELTLENGRRVPVRGEVVNNRLYVKDGLPKKPVRSLRLTNRGKDTQEIKLTLFRIGALQGNAPQSGDMLTDRDLTTVISCDSGEVSVNLSVPKGMRHAMVVGTASCSIKDAKAAGRESCIRRFELPADKKSIRLTAPQQKGKFISEVIFY